MTTRSNSINSDTSALTFITATDAMTALAPLDFTIAVPDLRNGNIADITQAAPKSSISREYKWVTYQGLPAERQIDAVDYIIRATYSQLMSALADDPGDAAVRDTRKKAIVIGSIRAGAAAAYRLMAQDMNVAECVNGPWRFAGDAMEVGDGTATNRHAMAVSMTELGALDVEVVSVLVYLGMAVPVLQGASLVNTGHHYLPTTRNIFAGTKKQALGLASTAAQTWIESMGETFDDMAFHKACHPISPPAKRRWAKSTEIADRLRASGHGAAAIRLPAIPSEAAIIKTALALARSALPVVNAMGHSMDIVDGPILHTSLENANEGPQEREAVAAIQNWAAVHMGTLAFCAGILQNVHETTGSGRNTLLSAFSVKKIMAEHPNEVARGTMYSRICSQRMREAMEGGLFPDPRISL